MLRAARCAATAEGTLLQAAECSCWQAHNTMEGWHLAAPSSAVWWRRPQQEVSPANCLWCPTWAVTATWHCSLVVSGTGPHRTARVLT